MNLGIDTHTRYAQVAVVDDDGNLQDELRVPNDQLEQLAEQYAGSDAAIEASGNYRPIYEVLDSHGRNFCKRSEPRNVSIQSEAKLIRSA